MTGYDVPTATQVPEHAWKPAAMRVVALFGGCALAGGALAPLVGWLWVTLADPPRVPLAAGGGIYLGEQALNQQSGVTLWFIVLGAGFGAVAGLAVGWFGQRFGWLSVVAVLVLCAVGCAASSYLGQHVFSADPRAEAASAHVGDLIRLDARLDTWVAYLGWPLGGVVGVLAAISGWSRSDRAPTLVTDSSPIL